MTTTTTQGVEALREAAEKWRAYLARGYKDGLFTQMQFVGAVDEFAKAVEDTVRASLAVSPEPQPDVHRKINTRNAERLLEDLMAQCDAIGYERGLKELATSSARPVHPVTVTVPPGAVSHEDSLGASPAGPGSTLQPQAASASIPGAGRRVRLTVQQLKNALYWANPDSDDGQGDTEVVIAWSDGVESDDEEQAREPGYVLWFADYPDEWCLPLDERPPGTPDAPRSVDSPASHGGDSDSDADLAPTHHPDCECDPCLDTPDHVRATRIRPQPTEMAAVVGRLRSLRVVLGIDSPETRGWAKAVQQEARRVIDAAIAAIVTCDEERHELKVLREFAGGRCAIPKVIEELGPMSLWSKARLEAHVQREINAALTASSEASK